jgi:integrase
MSIGSTFRRCACVDPETGRQVGRSCPKLRTRHHGTWGYTRRIETTGGARVLRRLGFQTEGAARAALTEVDDLIRLAAGDNLLRRRIGDLIFERSKYGGQLPNAVDVRQRIGAGLDPGAQDVPTGDWLENWLAGKGRLKASTRRSYRQHLDAYLLPALREIPLRRLSVGHVAAVFAAIEERNAAILAAKTAGDPPSRRAQVVGAATQRRIYATLRAALNAASRQRMIDMNPCIGVELPDTERAPQQVWSPAQVAAFLRATEQDRLHVLYRIILLHGLRRGEACGLRWEDMDLEAGRATIAQTVLELGGRVQLDTPKSRTSRRVLSIDRETARLLAVHRKNQARERLAGGPAYTDLGLVFCDEIGAIIRPDAVSRRFRKLAAAAGLPPIKLHEGRHTAATLAKEAGLDIKDTSARLGHSTTAITADIYTHVRQAVDDENAEKIAALIEPPEQAKETGS